MIFGYSFFYCALLFVFPFCAHSTVIETNYTYSGNYETITIPNGMNYAVVTLYGAAGGSGANSGNTLGLLLIFYVLTILFTNSF